MDPRETPVIYINPSLVVAVTSPTEQQGEFSNLTEAYNHLVNNGHYVVYVHAAPFHEPAKSAVGRITMTKLGFSSLFNGVFEHHSSGQAALNRFHRQGFSIDQISICISTGTYFPTVVEVELPYICPRCGHHIYDSNISIDTKSIYCLMCDHLGSQSSFDPYEPEDKFFILPTPNPIEEDAHAETFEAYLSDLIGGLIDLCLISPDDFMKYHRDAILPDHVIITQVIEAITSDSVPY